MTLVSMALVPYFVYLWGINRKWWNRQAFMAQIDQEIIGEAPSNDK